MIEPTPILVRQLWGYLARHYQTKTTQKSKSSVMRVVAWVLDKLGVVKHNQFIDSFNTTLLNHIYIAFVIGQAKSNWELISQIVTCVHEHAHVLQWRRDGLKFIFGYLFSGARRSDYEAEAYIAGWELWYYFTGATPDPDQQVNVLKFYSPTQGPSWLKIQQKDINRARAAFKLAKIQIENGSRINCVAKEAINWLDKHIQDGVEALKPKQPIIE